MATLIRSRQGEFDSSLALTYEELERGESVWGPILEKMLDGWNAQHPEPEEPWTDDRDRLGSSKKRPWSGSGGQRKERDERMKNDKMERNYTRIRRNTSSGEE